MILESIVTTVDAEGHVNIAPMGPRVAPGCEDAEVTEIQLRPFDASRTYRNLVATRKAVVHVTDDARLFARAAAGVIEPREIAEIVRQLGGDNWWVLKDCHRWFAVEVESISNDRPRVDMNCRVVRSETVRPFFGFNRGKHAVIEAAILATRTHLLSSTAIDDELSRLQPLVDKTGGPDEHDAFDLLRSTINERIAQQ